MKFQKHLQQADMSSQRGWKTSRIFATNWNICPSPFATNNYYKN